MEFTKEAFERAAQSAENPVWLEDRNDCRKQYVTLCGLG